MIKEYWGSQCKSDTSIDRGSKKCFPGMLAKGLWTLVKVCHCPRELLWRKWCVNRHKVTHFCVINQFCELLEGTMLQVESRCKSISCDDECWGWCRMNSKQHGPLSEVCKSTADQQISCHLWNLKVIFIYKIFHTIHVPCTVLTICGHVHDKNSFTSISVITPGSYKLTVWEMRKRRHFVMGVDTIPATCCSSSLTAKQR
jgi:hypothetical protein